jgi:hypothetical protein
VLPALDDAKLASASIGSIASRLAVAASRSSANWGRYCSTDVVNELTSTSVGSEPSYALPYL